MPPLNDRVRDARALAARLRSRELERACPRVTVTGADPDARESVASSGRMFWPPNVLDFFKRAHVIRNPVRLYDDVPADVVRAAEPIR